MEAGRISRCHDAGCTETTQMSVKKICVPEEEECVGKTRGGSLVNRSARCYWYTFPTTIQSTMEAVQPS
jgi:hypothetical protein